MDMFLQSITELFFVDHIGRQSMGVWSTKLR